jgi:hypothetical protein
MTHPARTATGTTPEGAPRAPQAWPGLAEGARRPQVQDEFVVSETLAGRHSTQSCSSTRSSSNFTGLAR